MINEHISSKDPSTLTDDDRRPPSRAAKWKRARTKKSGEYTSDASKVVAERIVSKIWKLLVNNIFVIELRSLKLIAFFCFAFCRILLLKK
jgi:hypothetical protein